MEPPTAENGESPCALRDGSADAGASSPADVPASAAEAATGQARRGSRAAAASFLALCTVSVFASAFLLFAVEPMVARLLLPFFGGSPSVWNTALVFYQAVLLAGYAYAHWSLRRLGIARQMLLHAAVLTVPLLALPPGSRVGQGAPPSAWPVPWVLLALLAAVGLPFFALSSNSSLVQRWLSASLPVRGADPYRLYAASNAGSLLALVAYPFLVEPRLGVRLQTGAWAVGYLGFALLSAVLMVAAARYMRGAHSTGAAGREPAPRASPIGRGRRAAWVVRAAVPSSLLLSVTLLLTTDVVSMPLLWVAPLALYLLSYILAFALPERLPRRAIAAATIACIVVALAAVTLQLMLPIAILLLVALAPLFLGSLLCHLDLARDRPDPVHLTEFYLWLAVGGVVGGALNSLVAPLVFDTVAEWPITLAFLAWLAFAAGAPGRRPGARPWRQPGLVLPALTILVWTAVVVWNLARGPEEQLTWWLVVLLLALPYALALPRRRALFPLAAAALGFVAVAGLNSTLPVTAQARSFFGVMRVRTVGDRRVLMHGTTIHGSQSLEPALAGVPGNYYYPSSPMGSVVATQPLGARIALVGLGTGALAALGKPGQRMDVFEIDPVVEDLARRYFTYLDDSPADVRVDIVDGRLGLERARASTYDLVVEDAFSSDSVPAHLLTAESLDLSLSRTRPEGLVVYHISNRSLDLARVFRGWSRRTGRPVALAEWRPTDEERRRGASTSIAAAVAPSSATIDRLIVESDGMWKPLDAEGPSVAWTDDFSNVLSVLRRPW